MSEHPQDSTKAKENLVIHLHGSPGYIPGRRVSVLDVMLWKMYGLPHRSIIEAPKHHVKPWRIITRASQWPGFNDNPETKVLLNNGVQEWIQETTRIDKYPFFNSTIKTRLKQPKD